MEHFAQRIDYFLVWKYYFVEKARLMDLLRIQNKRIPDNDRIGRRWELIRHARALTLREVEERSRELVAEYGSERFLLCKARLSGIESGETMPTLHRLFALCEIYKLSIVEVLGWYGLNARRRVPSSRRRVFHIN